MSDNQTGEEFTSRKWKWNHFWECFKDPQVYFVFANTLLACIPNGYGPESLVDSNFSWS